MIEPAARRPTRRLVTAKLLRTLLDSAVRLGVEEEPILKAIGVPPEVASDPRAWVTAEQMASAWVLVPERSGRPDFGVAAALTTPVGAYGALDFATMSSPTVAEALMRLERYYRLLGGMSDVSFVRTPRGGGIVTVRLLVGRANELRHYTEHFMALVTTRIRMAARAKASDVTARFVHSNPSDMAALQEVFGPAVRFGTDANALEFPREVVEAPLISANPELAEMLEVEAERARLRPDAPLRERVRQALDLALREGDPSLPQVAKRLGVSSRTLQRKLQLEGTSFGDELDAARAEVARRLVEKGSESFGEIAFLLGFSQPSAFHRAFKRWTGTTPKTFRSHAPPPLTE